MKREKLIRIITCTAAFFAVSTIPVLGADGWQQDSVHQWVYMENDKKLVASMDGWNHEICGRKWTDCNRQLGNNR